jgi:hypothetical protein
MPSLEDLSSEARDELASLARQLAESPDTREAFLRLTKKARPEMTIDSLDVKDQLEARNKELTDKYESLENKLRERDAREELDRRRQNLVRNGKAKSDDEVSEIEKLMLEKGIQNHETAAEYYSLSKQSAQPTSPNVFSNNFLNETARDTLSKFNKNPIAAARDEAAKALNEIRKNPRPIGF